MAIKKYEDWMIGKKVKLVDAHFPYGSGTNELYARMIGKCGIIIGPNGTDKIIVDGIDVEHNIFYTWRLKLVKDEPLPLPG